MRRIYLLTLMCGLTLWAVAQKNAPKWLEKQRKAVITVTTYGNDEKVLHSGTGFFITETGEALSGYELFKDAKRATVTDTDGNSYPITSIMGADELYDVIHFKINTGKKVPFLQIAAEPLSTGAKVYLVPYTREKKGTFQEGTISEISKLKDPYGYYKTTIPFSVANAPILTESGQVIGLTQEDAAGDKQISYAVSAGYINSLTISSTDLLNTTYSRIGIRKAWPADVEQANVTLYLLGSTQDAKTYLETLNDFIASFPDYAEGYINRASHYAYRRADLSNSLEEQKTYLSRALEDLETAGKYNTKKDDVLYNKARVIFNVASSDTTITDKDWSVASALNTLQLAIGEEDLPIYRQLEGDIYMALGIYEMAYDSYMKVNESELASPASYYLASKALENTPGANIGDMIALLDKAIDKSGVVVTEDVLAYILERVDYKMKLMLYDEAVADYNLYYEKTNGQVGDAFYYYRQQAKFRAGDFTGAMADIQEALKLMPDEPNYLAEEASIYIRLENYDQALVSLKKALELAPDFASCHRLLGICLVRTNKKAEACEAFNKAKELGDPLANRLIREHCQ